MNVIEFTVPFTKQWQIKHFNWILDEHIVSHVHAKLIAK